MSTPKDDAERILRKSAKKDIEETHKLGLPVRTVEEDGVIYIQMVEKNM